MSEGGFWPPFLLPMTNAFEQAMAGIFADPNMSQQAVYTPATGEPKTVRVIARRPDEVIGFGETRIHAETTLFDVKTSEIPDPRPGDRLTVSGVDYVVQGEPERRDPDRLVWTLDVRPA